MMQYNPLVSLVVVAFTVACAQAAKFYQVDKHMLCEGVPDSAAKFDNMHIVGKLQAITISGTMEVIRDVQPPIQFHLAVNRCEMDKTNCQHFDTITFDDVCPMYNENHFVKAHFGFFSPPFGCPMQIGKYTAKDGVLDMKLFEGFAIGNAHWQAEMKIIDGFNKTAVCIWSEVSITEKAM